MKIKLKQIWAKAHSDNFGNELADSLSKKEANSVTTPLIYQFTPNYIRSKLLNINLDRWKTYWQTSKTGKHLFPFSSTCYKITY